MTSACLWFHGKLSGGNRRGKELLSLCTQGKKNPVGPHVRRGWRVVACVRGKSKEWFQRNELAFLSCGSQFLSFSCDPPEGLSVVRALPRSAVGFEGKLLFPLLFFSTSLSSSSASFRAPFAACSSLAFSSSANRWRFVRSFCCPFVGSARLILLLLLVSACLCCLETGRLEIPFPSARPGQS